MRKLRHGRDPIKEFIMSLAPRLDCLVAEATKGGLPARARPGLSEKTRSRQLRRGESLSGAQ